MMATAAPLTLMANNKSVTEAKNPTPPGSMSSSSSSGSLSVEIIDECQRERCLSLELKLEAIQVDNMILKEENAKLKEDNQMLTEKLKNLEGDNDLPIRNLNIMKAAVKKLYSVAEAVLAAMDGSDVMEDRDYSGVEDTLIVDVLCSDLQERLKEWQGTHQKLHDKLEQTLKATEELAEQFMSNKPAPPPVKKKHNLSCWSEEESPGPASSSSFHVKSSMMTGASASSSSSTRRNPLRRCRVYGTGYSPGGGWQDPAQFPCDNCGNTYCRLGHLELKLRMAKKLNMTPMVMEPQTGGVKTEKESPEAISKTATSSTEPVNGDHQEQGQTSADVKMDVDIKTEPGGNNITRPQITITDPSGQEHKFAGSYKTILPSEQAKTLLEGSAPLKQLRYFCKCGRHYANWAALFHHIKFIGKNSKGFKCGLCQKDFEIRNGMKAHLQDAHGVEYCQGRFSCLECGEDFGTIKEVDSHQQLAHKNGVEVVEEVLVVEDDKSSNDKDSDCVMLE